MLFGEEKFEDAVMVAKQVLFMSFSLFPSFSSLSPFFGLLILFNSIVLKKRSFVLLIISSAILFLHFCKSTHFSSGIKSRIKVLFK